MKQKYLSSGIQKKYLKSTLILLLLALLLSMIGVWSYMHHTLKNNIIEKYEFADEKMGILLDNLYTKSKEVTAEAILNETIQKSLNAEELTDNEKNAVGKYFSYLDLDSIQDYCYMDNKGNIYTRSYSYVDAFDIKNTVFQKKLGTEYAKTVWFIAKDTLFNGKEDSLFITRYVHSLDYPSEPGIIILKMNPSFLNHIVTMDSEKADSSILTGIMDQNGNIYALNQKNTALPDNVTKTLISACKKSSDTGIILNGEAVTGGYLSAYYQKDCSFSIFTYVPNEVVTSQTTQILIVLVLIYLIIVVLALLLSILFSNRFTRPVQEITTYMTGFDGGDYTHMPELHTNTELDQIGHSYNEMLGNIEQLVNEIKLQEKELRTSELNMLISQINPHFLYNTLESITWMVEAQKNREAVIMISELAKLLRVSLSRGKTIIPIKDELQHSRSYMNIQLVRYKERFKIDFQIDEELYNYCIVKLVIQPILENAIYYGVGHMDEDDDGRIVVSGEKKDNDIYISIEDNGMGMRKEVLENILTDNNKVPKHGSGVGVINVHSRIKLMFGEGYGLTVYSEPDEGTKVVIHIPAIPYTKENAEKLEMQKYSQRGKAHEKE